MGHTRGRAVALSLLWSRAAAVGGTKIRHGMAETRLIILRHGGLRAGWHDIFWEAPARTSAFPRLFPLEAAFVNGDGSFAVVLSESGGVMAGQHFDLAQA